MSDLSEALRILDEGAALTDEEKDLIVAAARNWDALTNGDARFILVRVDALTVTAEASRQGDTPPQ